MPLSGMYLYDPTSSPEQRAATKRRSDAAKARIRARRNPRPTGRTRLNLAASARLRRIMACRSVEQLAALYRLPVPAVPPGRFLNAAGKPVSAAERRFREQFHARAAERRTETMAQAMAATRADGPIVAAMAFGGTRVVTRGGGVWEIDDTARRKASAAAAHRASLTPADRAAAARRRHAAGRVTEAAAFRRVSLAGGVFVI